MRKSTIVGVSILSIFILCSLSYQPIIAEPIETITQVKESKVSSLDAYEIKEVYYKFIELKFQSKDDCGCDKDNTEFTSPDYPIICDILWAMLGLGFLIWNIFFFVRLGLFLGEMIGLMALILGKKFFCPWADSYTAFEQTEIY